MCHPFVPALVVLTALPFLAQAPGSRLPGPDTTLVAENITTTESFFRERSDSLLKAYLDWRPGFAVSLGLHEYDGKAPNLSVASLDAELKRLKLARAEVASLEAALGRSKSNPKVLLDAHVLRAALEGEIFSFEEARGYWRNPMTYAGGLDVSAYIKRDFAPLPARMRSVVALLNATPAYLAAARANLEEVLPKPYVETAMLIAQGSAEFLARDLVEALHGVDDAGLQSAFKAANERAISELRAFAAWLEKERLPRADSSFALGADRFRRLLASTELVDMDPAALLVLGKAELKREQTRFAAAAKIIDPSKSPAEVFKAIQGEHPTADRLIPEIAARLEAARAFVVKRDLVTVPSEVRATVAETPRFQRAQSFASMDSPGPFETKASEAFYYVTPVEPNWTPQQAEEWLTAFNYATADVVNIHEAYPGHYVQFLHVNASEASRIAKIFTSYAFVEGWAHYCEQMVVEEGFGSESGDRIAAAKVRLAQSDEALLRICRLCTAVMLHCQNASVDDAAKFFEENGFYAPKPARQEALRGTYDPGFCNYTLGKLQILKLRDDWKKQEGKTFTLKRFHDELLRHGSPQIRLLRAIMLRDPKQYDRILN